MAPDAVVNAHDANSAIESLIGAVRRTLWRGRLQRATRTALWTWALIMTAGATLHAVAGRPGLATMLFLGGVAWLATLAAAGLQRPKFEAAALYADRRLGGQSAYSTWLETHASDSVRGETAAGRRLLEWSAAIVPASRDALARERTAWQLLRPFAAAAIGTMLAIAVTVLVGPRPVPGAARDEAVEPAAVEAPLLDEWRLADTIATELTAQNPGDRTTNGRSDATPATGDRSAVASPIAESEAVLADPGSARHREASGISAAQGDGREAGSTRDDSTAGALSHAAQGPMSVQRRNLDDSAGDVEHLANDERVASYQDEADGGGHRTVVSSAVAAARAPAARREVQLSPAEAAYVTSWRTDSRAEVQERE